MAEAVVVVLDVGRSMGTRSSASLEDAKRAICLLLRNKMIFNPKDEVGLVLVGTGHTNNAQASECGPGQYEHITEACPITLPDLGFLRAVENADENGGANGDVLDAVIVALGMFEARSGGSKKTFKDKRIIIVTDGGMHVAGVDQLEAISKGFQNQNVHLQLIGVSFPPLPEDMEEEGEDSDGEAPAPMPDFRGSVSQEAIYKLTVMVGGDFVPINDALSMLSNMRSKSVRQTTSCRTGLQVGTITIPVWGYLKTQEQKFPTLKKVSVPALQAGATLDGGLLDSVHIETTLFPADNSEETVDEEKCLRAFRYGKDLIPYSGVELAALKFEATKCLHVIGFVEKSEIPMHYLMSHSTCFVSWPGDQTASVALSAFVQAMIELDRAAFVRYVYQNGREPKVGFLFAGRKVDFDCLYFVQGPFAEDIRCFQFGSFDGVDVSEEQQEVADSLVASMDLDCAMFDEEGEDVEALKPKLTFNPVLQHFYQCLQFKALHPDEPLPSLDPAIACYTIPEEASDGPLARVFERSEGACTLFSSVFKTKRIVVSESGQKRKLFDGEAPDTNLDSYGIAQKRQNTTMISDSAGGASSSSSGIKIENLFNRKATEVSTADPVKDFEDMFDNRETDLVEKAIQGMKEVIHKLIKESVGDQYYDKVLDCLLILRKGCIQEDEPEHYNSFLRELRSQLEVGKRNDLWERLRASPGAFCPISSKECEESDLDPSEAARFFETAVPEPEPMSVDILEPDQEDDLEGLLD